MDALREQDPRRIGPWRTVGRLGEGGMGVVYAALAEDGSKVAVKVIRSEYAADAQFRVRFRREVSLVARIEGACVARFLGADTDAAVPWLATGFVPGPTLSAQVSEEGPLTGSPVSGQGSLAGSMLLSLAAGVAEALAVIHRAGVVHRDLKPGNVILSPDGPKVLDFGIARAFDSTAITSTQAFVGTPGWASPEQYRGEETGPRSDVYGWGALVAYAATGRRPLGEGSAEVMAHRTLHAEPDLTGVPDGLRELVGAALAKHPDDRPSVGELVAALAGLGHVPAGDATDVATRIIAAGWAPRPTTQPDWRPPSRFSPRRTLVVTGTALALVISLGALATVLADRGSGHALAHGSGRTPAASGSGRTPDAHGSGSTLADPGQGGTAAGGHSAIPSPSPSIFRPPASWLRASVNGATVSYPSDWTNGYGTTSDTGLLCLLPPGTPSQGNATCLGSGLVFTVEPQPLTLDSDAEWRQQIGVSVGFATTAGTQSAAQIKGSFINESDAYVGTHLARHRTFELTTYEGAREPVDAWWLPADKLWICSSVSSQWGTVVGDIIAAVDFTGYRAS